MAETYGAIYGEDIVKLVLYGSYARGNNQVDSDIDIVGIVRGDQTDLQEQLKNLGCLSRSGVRVCNDCLPDGHTFS